MPVTFIANQRLLELSVKARAARGHGSRQEPAVECTAWPVGPPATDGERLATIAPGDAGQFADARPTVGSGPLTAGGRVFDAGDANGRVVGDLGPGAQARGGGAMVIEGALAAAKGSPCIVHVLGEAIVGLGATHANIDARSIRIAGDVHGCRLVAVDAVHIGGDLAASEVVVGAFDDRQRDLKALHHQSVQTAQEHRLLAQRLAGAERHLHRLVKTTRLSCEINLGQVVRWGSARVQVNLKALYKVIGDRPPDQVEAALTDFFSRGVAGSLARANGDYLKSNPNNQKVFIRVLGHLRRLFTATRLVDECATRLEKIAASIHAATAYLAQLQTEVHVRGSAGPDVQLQFVLPQVQELRPGEVSVQTLTAGLRIGGGGDASGRVVVLVDQEGVETTLTVPPEQLRGVTIKVEEGRVGWSPLVASGSRS